MTIESQRREDARRIESLKKEARKNYHSYLDCGNYLDCGATLAEVLKPEMGLYRQRFNAVMEQLEQLDPTAPKFRL
jgi:hypothetical protein